MNPSKLQLEKKEMFKCESCQGFHSAEESEIVVIKIVKGKNCQLKSPIAPVVLPTMSTVFPDKFPTMITHPGGNGVVSHPVQTPQNNGIINNEPVPPKPVKKIIPPGIASMMLDPSHPMFEMMGAKETRKM